MKLRVFFLVILVLLASCKRQEQLGEFTGVVWQEQQSGTTVGLRGVFAVDDRIAWASGSDGTFLRTIDGGESWQVGTVPGAESLYFRDVYAVDSDVALLLNAGQPAKIYKTKNGGDYWTEIYSNNTPGIFFNSMAFWDEHNGIACGDPINGSFMIIKTENGGETWTQIPPENIPVPINGEAQFAASGTCITVCGDDYVWFATGGPAARVFRSLNGGYDWRVQETPVLCGTSSTGIFSITFRDELNGVIVGGDYQDEALHNKNAAITADGGMTWSLVEKAPPAGYRSCVTYVPNTKTPTLITVGPTGSDFSVDDGLTWTPLDTIAYHSIGFAPSQNVGWTVGGNGRIAKVVPIFN